MFLVRLISLLIVSTFFKTSIKAINIETLMYGWRCEEQVDGEWDEKVEWWRREERASEPHKVRIISRLDLLKLRIGKQWKLRRTVEISKPFEAVVMEILLALWQAHKRWNLQHQLQCNRLYLSLHSYHSASIVRHSNIKSLHQGLQLLIYTVSALHDALCSFGFFLMDAMLHYTK